MAASGDVCADRDALRTSVDSLQDVDVAAEGTNGLEAALGDVKDDLAALSASAGAELQPQVQAVQDAVGQVETAAANLDSGGAADGRHRRVRPGERRRCVVRLARGWSVWLAHRPLGHLSDDLVRRRAVHTMPGDERFHSLCVTTVADDGLDNHLVRPR